MKESINGVLMKTCDEFYAGLYNQRILYNNRIKIINSCLHLKKKGLFKYHELKKLPKWLKSL